MRTVLLSSDIEEHPNRLADLILAVFGIYVWEYINTSRVELNIRASFHWSDAVYFACRYSCLLFMFGLVLCVSSARLDRNALLTMISVAEVFVIAAATNILALRVAAIWKERCRVFFPLLFVVIFHWVLLCSTLAYIQLWSGTSISSFNDLHRPRPILQVAAVFTTLFHVALFLGVVRGQRSWSSNRCSMRHILANDGIYFALVLVAGAVDLVLDFTCAAREVHQGLRIVACAIIGITACRFFRRFDQHHRPRITEETAPIIAATRRLARRHSQTLLSLLHPSQGVSPLPAAHIQPATACEYDGRMCHNRIDSNSEIFAQPSQRALYP